MAAVAPQVRLRGVILQDSEIKSMLIESKIMKEIERHSGCFLYDEKRHSVATSKSYTLESSEPEQAPTWPFWLTLGLACLTTVVCLIIVMIDMRNKGWRLQKSTHCFRQHDFDQLVVVHDVEGSGP